MPRLIVAYWFIGVAFFSFFPNHQYVVRGKLEGGTWYDYLMGFGVMWLVFWLVFVTCESAFVSIVYGLVLYLSLLNGFGSEGGYNMSMAKVVIPVCFGLSFMFLFLDYGAMDWFCNFFTFTGRSVKGVYVPSYLATEGAVFYYPFQSVLPLFFISLGLAWYTERQNQVFFRTRDLDYFLTEDLNGMEYLSRYFAEEHYRRVGNQKEN
jgi:hypothetical protein